MGFSIICSYWKEIHEVILSRLAMKVKQFKFKLYMFSMLCPHVINKM